MVDEPLGGVPVRRLPDVLAGVHVDRDDPAVGGLEDREALRAPEVAPVDHGELREGGSGRHDVVRIVDLLARDEALRTASPRGGDVHDPRLGIGGGGVLDVHRPARAAHEGAEPRGMADLDRGVEERPDLVVLDDLERLGPELGRVVDQVILGEPLHLVGGRARRERLRGGELFSRHVRLRDGPLLDRPDRLARLPVEGVGEPLLGRLHDDRHGLPVHIHIERDRRRRVVEVPDVVVHGLEVPYPLPGLDVEGDHARPVEAVARTEPPVEVDRGGIGRDVDDPPLGIGRHRGPGGDVARPLPRIVLPSLVAELPRARDHIELPHELTGARIVAEDVARDVLDPRLVVALLGGVAHHDDAVDDDRGRGVRDVAELPRDPEVRVVGTPVPLEPRPPVGDQVGEEIHDARLGESVERNARPPVLERPARLGIQGVEEEGGRDDVDDAPAVHLRVGDPLPVAVPHPAVEARRVRLAVRPDRLARRRLQRDDIPPLPRHGVEEPVHVDGRRAGDPEGEGPEVVAPPDPGDLEVLEVLRRDLVEPGVARVPRVPSDVSPLAGRRPPVLRPERRAEECCRSDRDRESPGAPARGSAAKN